MASLAAHIAAAEGNLTAFQILVDAGTNLEGEDRWGNTPMDEARRHGSTRILMFLKERMINSQHQV
jgi:ankyrin repeat protein